jgi:hypothetical protein
LFDGSDAKLSISLKSAFVPREVHHRTKLLSQAGRYRAILKRTIIFLLECSQVLNSGGRITDRPDEREPPVDGRETTVKNSCR